MWHQMYFFLRNFCDFSIFFLQLRGFFVAFHRLSKITYFCDGMHAILGIYATTVISKQRQMLLDAVLDGVMCDLLGSLFNSQVFFSDYSRFPDAAMI